MKKFRKSASLLSMENLDVDRDSVSDNDDEEQPNQNGNKKENGLAGLKVDSEHVILHPIFVLGQAFQKVSAVGSSTAMIGIRN